MYEGGGGGGGVHEAAICCRITPFFFEIKPPKNSTKKNPEIPKKELIYPLPSYFASFSDFFLALFFSAVFRAFAIAIVFS